MKPLIFQNSLRWQKCLFLQFIHYDKFVGVKPNTMVRLVVSLRKSMLYKYARYYWLDDEAKGVFPTCDTKSANIICRIPTLKQIAVS